MSLSIVALDRGGYTAHGQANYDPREDAVILNIGHDSETRELTAQFPDDIDSVTTEVSGIASTTPTIDGNSFTATLSSLNNGGFLDYLVTTTESGTRRLRLIVQGTTRFTSDYGWPYP